MKLKLKTRREGPVGRTNHGKSLGDRCLECSFRDLSPSTASSVGMQQGLRLGEVHALVIPAGGQNDEAHEAQQEEGDLQHEGDPAATAYIVYMAYMIGCL